MNPAYKTLDDRMRLGPFTVTQWALLVVIAFCAVGYALYLTPFGPAVTLVTTIYAAGVSAGIVLVAGVAEFDCALYARACLAWRRLDGPHRPGPGSGARGYVVWPAEDGGVAGGALETSDLDLASLWD
jgi:hypothetical protein